MCSSDLAFINFRDAFATASCVVALYSGPEVDIDLFAVEFAKNSPIAEFAVDTDCYDAYDEDIFPTTLLTVWIENNVDGKFDERFGVLLLKDSG